jgi:Chemotaxis response regulator containing a CheY-like receiver domain and a methylesterase domain
MTVQVLVVDDSAFMRQTLKAMIEEDAALHVVATARNGQDALKKIALFHPDVVTLDIVMDGDMDGLQVLHRIMKEQPTPTIMVSGADDQNVNYVLEAISSGAFDFIFKPSGMPSEIEEIAHQLQIKIREASVSRMHHPPARSVAESAAIADPVCPPADGIKQRFSLVLIGTSTGGPRALQVVVPGLRRKIPAPILVIQHMPPKFTKSLAVRLDGLSECHVTEAGEGELLENGHVYIAPGGLHLQVLPQADGRLVAHLLDTPAVHGVRPSVDVTLDSFNQIKDYDFVIAILTGMGRDGADGLETLKRTGRRVYAIAESQASCVVYGMPRAAVDTGRVDTVRTIQEVAPAICGHYDLTGR